MASGDDQKNETSTFDSIKVTLTEMQKTIENITAIVVALLAQHGDPTHVDVARAAQLCGCSKKTIRRRIDAGQLTLEVVPGTRKSGIPVEQIYSRWLPIHVARAAVARGRAERSPGQIGSIGAASPRSRE